MGRSGRDQRETDQTARGDPASQPDQEPLPKHSGKRDEVDPDDEETQATPACGTFSGPLSSARPAASAATSAITTSQ